jgi:hypothetical protein
MKCQICETKITKKNEGFFDLLNNEEQKRLLNLKKEQTICIECKHLLMIIDILSPFKI